METARVRITTLNEVAVQLIKLTILRFQLFDFVIIIQTGVY